MPLNILRIAERLPPLPGGKEIHVLELTRAQRALGHNVQLLYRLGGDPFAQTETPVPVPRPFDRMNGLPGAAAFAIAAMRRARALGSIDVIHAHGDLAEAWAISRLARRPRPITVLTVHGQLNPRYRRLSEKAFAEVDAFIALGDKVNADLQGCGVDPARITTTSSGLNTRLLHGARVDQKTPGLVVTVGTLDPVKNMDTIIAAIRAMPRSIEVRLDIIGDGPERAPLERLAGDDHRIRFLGHLSREEVYERVAAAQLFVIASKRQPGKGEGVPTALLEAMSLGTPCLVSSDASPGSVVQDHSSYMTFSPHNSDGLSEMIVRVLNDETGRANLSQRAADAVAGLSWEARANQTEEIYERALALRLATNYSVDV